MKLLIQDSNGNLVWQEVTYSDKRFRSLDGQTSYELTDIYAVKDDNRNKTVICSSCGKEVPNTTAAKRAHQNIIHRTDKCFNCAYMYKDIKQTLSQKYVANEDGTYTESCKTNVNLLCNMRWSNRNPINTDAANRHCRYAGCQSATFNAITDFWTKYPDAFDEFITADRLIDAGYSEPRRNGDTLLFDLNGKVELTAYVNLQGVCTDFKLRFHRSTYTVRYSKKYDKLFVLNCGRFSDLSIIEMSESSEKSIMRKLRNLYS